MSSNGVANDSPTKNWVLAPAFVPGNSSSPQPSTPALQPSGIETVQNGSPHLAVPLNSSNSNSPQASLAMRPSSLGNVQNGGPNLHHHSTFPQRNPSPSQPSSTTMQMQPLIMEIMQDGDSHMYHHENLSQLLYEREQHAIHKHLLEAEQVKVHELQIKLDEKESQIRALVSSSRLNAEVLNAAIQRIEPKVISMAKDLAVLNAPHRAAHHTADHEAGPGEISSGSRHDSKMSSSSPESSQLSSQGVVDQRRSLLYDIFVKLGNDGRGGWPDHHSSAAGGLRRGSQITEGEKFPDHHTSVVGGTEPSAVRQDDTHRAIVAKHLNQTVIDTTMEKASNQYDERGNDLWNLGTHADSLVPGDFSSLDQAFENDIFSKSGKGLNRPLLEEQILDNSLIEMFSEKPESTSSDHEDTMDGEKSKSRAETMENSESEQNTALGNAVAEPVLGVERRTYHTKPLQFEIKPWKECPNLATLPTLRLVSSFPSISPSWSFIIDFDKPSSFLEKACGYRSISPSSDSRGSPELDNKKTSQLAFTNISNLHLPPQNKALNLLKMSDIGGESEETVRPGSAQRRRMELEEMRAAQTDNDLAASMRKMSLENTPSHDDPAASGATTTVAGTGSATSNIRPSSGIGDNYNVIRVNIANLNHLVDWTMGQNATPLYDSELDKERRYHDWFDKQNYRKTQFWLWPVRYEPSVHEPNACRTVHIDHIPKNVTVHDVAMQVCCGLVESIELIDIGKLRGPQGPVPANHKFARVVFVEGKAASDFQYYAHNKPLTLGGKPVRVYLQMEPTYPMRPEVDQAVYHKKMTRILSVFGLTPDALKKLPAWLKARKVEPPIYTDVHPHDHLSEEDWRNKFETKTLMEFRSIIHARWAVEEMEGVYPGVEGFLIEPDYCEREP